MAKGRLTNTEKYAIQGMLHQKKSIEEISQELGRTQSTIKKYVEGELDKIHEQVTKLQLVQAEENKKLKKEVKKLSKQKKELTSFAKIKEDASKELALQNVPQDKIGILIARAIKQNGTPMDKDTLVVWAMACRTAGDMMVHTTGGGKGNVAIMTQAASEKVEASDTTPNGLPRSLKGNIFNIREKKYE